jgi:hypothetical protein
MYPRPVSEEMIAMTNPAASPPHAAPANTPTTRLPVVPPAQSKGLTATSIGIGLLVYVVLTAGFAGYLLWMAFTLPPVERMSDFIKLAIGALIAIIGTGITAVAAVFSATRQSATAFQVASYNGEIATILAAMKESADTRLFEMKDSADKKLIEVKSGIDQALANLKANSDESLAKLKVALDASQNANRELFGTASVYFYALRSIAVSDQWDVESLKSSETAMIAATKDLLNVREDLRNQWFDFWQRAQDIYREASSPQLADDERAPLVRKLLEKEIEFRSGKCDLHRLQGKMEETAKAAIEQSLAKTQAVPPATPGPLATPSPVPTA